MTAMPPARIKVGNRWIGTGEPCYVIAEAGSNHNGSLEHALALIDVASEAGADAVKFQGFRARTLYPKTAGKSQYLKDERPIYDIIEAMEMSVEWVPILADHCRARSVDFLCTPFDEAWVDALDPHVPAFKVASYELSHLPLVRRVLERGKPAFVSTGAHRRATGRRAGARGGQRADRVSPVHGRVSRAARGRQRPGDRDPTRGERVSGRPVRSLAGSRHRAGRCRRARRGGHREALHAFEPPAGPRPEVRRGARAVEGTGAGGARGPGHSRDRRQGGPRSRARAARLRAPVGLLGSRDRWRRGLHRGQHPSVA